MQPRPWREHLPAGSGFVVDDLTRRRSLPAAWADAWAADAGAPLLYDAGAGSAARWVSAGEFDDRTTAAARRLLAAGLGRGDRLLWSTGSSLEAVVAVVAALRAGLVVVPANAAYTAREITHIVSDVAPRAAVVDDPERARWVTAAAAPDPVTVFSVGLDVVTGAAPASTRRHDGELDAADGGAPALIAYTSGTTGAPKGAVLSHGNVLANSESVAVTWRWESDDRLVHALPIFHGHGLCVALFTSLLRRSSVVLLPRFDPAAVTEAVTSTHATLFFGVPTMYHRLVASAGVAALGRLRLAVSGSAPLSAELHDRIRRAAGVDVLERYGMTETLMTLSNPYDGARRPGTVGFPFPGVDAVLTDGEILVRGPTVFGGYWRRPAATAERFVDGWFRTEDLAEIDDGYVRIRGRASDLIVSGGYNVYPAEVEDVLLGHPAVAEVAVAATPSEEWGEAVTAWVVTNGAPPPAADVLAFAAGQLAPYKRPRIVHFVSELPRTALGKVRRAELRSPEAPPH